MYSESVLKDDRELSNRFHNGKDRLVDKCNNSLSLLYARAYACGRARLGWRRTVVVVDDDDGDAAASLLMQE